VFLSNVDLSVSFDGTQRGNAKDRNDRFQSYAVVSHRGVEVRSSPSRYLNMFECLFGKTLYVKVPCPPPFYCIGVGTVVLCIHEQRIVAVNVHSRRTRPAPGADHDVPTLYCSHMHLA
jgi:hypothetical protein